MIKNTVNEQNIKNESNKKSHKTFDQNIIPSIQCANT